MTEQAAPAKRILGVTLEQYAGLQAVIAQGFPLEEALTNEQLSASAWQRARMAWGAKIAREGHGGPLSAALREKLGEAADWLGRRVAPLDDDLAAWLGFLGAYAAEPAPSVLLKRLGMRDDDVQRLAASWKQRTDSDEALAKKAIEIAKTQPKAVPRVRVSEGKLRPFPWSPGPTSAKTRARGAASTGTPRSASPPSETAPAQVQVELPSFLLARAASAEPAPSAALSPPAAPPPAAPVVPAPAKIAETALGLVLPIAAAMPFDAGAASARPAPEDSPPPGAAPAKSASPSTGTVLALDLPAAALPFPERAPSPEAPAPATAAQAPPAPAPAPANPAPSQSGSLSTGTVLALDLPATLDVPFKAPAQAPSKLTERVSGSDLAAIARAVQARSAAAAPKKADPPVLTLQQHASLCAELAFHPDQTAQILARYHVTEEQKRALDDAYAERSDQKAEWDKAYQTYFEWLSSAGRSRS